MCLKHRFRKRVQQLKTVSVKLHLRDERTDGRTKSSGRTDRYAFFCQSVRVGTKACIDLADYDVATRQWFRWSVVIVTIRPSDEQIAQCPNRVKTTVYHTRYTFIYMNVQHITLPEFQCRQLDIPTSTARRPATATQRGQ